MKKVLLKNNLEVSQRQYDKYENPTDKYYYYVHYSNKPDQEGNYLLFTNPLHFKETRLLFKSSKKEDVIQNAQNINNSLRLMAGYYDDDATYKEQCFPSIPIK